MKKLILVAVMITAAAYIAGGNTKDQHDSRNRIKTLSMKLPVGERRLVDTIIFNDRLINATLEVVVDISQK